MQEKVYEDANTNYYPDWIFFFLPGSETDKTVIKKFLVELCLKPSCVTFSIVERRSAIQTCSL